MSESYYDKQGREIKAEMVDGVLRHSVVRPASAEAYVANGRLMTDADLRACQKDSRYATDANYRAAVLEHMRRSHNAGTNFQVGSQEFGVLERAMAADNANSDEIQIQREAVTSYFSDPRYAKSATFRAWVKEQIRTTSDPRWEQDLGGTYRYDVPVRLTGQFAPEPPEGTEK